MDTIFNDVCVSVAAAFALTLVPSLRQPERSFLSRRDQGAALLVFTILGLVEEATASHAGLLNERIVAVCAAGLVAGPWVGLAVGVFVTWLAVAHHGLPLGSIATAMLCGGLAGGWLCRWRPKLARHPLTGFFLTLGVSLLRNGLVFFCAPSSPAAPQRIEEIGTAPVLQGLGTALILAIIEQVRDRDEQTRAAALAETRALQARMNPHFLFNALNALAALATVAPREVPRAAGRLRQFLRASFDQQERLLVPLEEELAVVSAYLDIESLRLGNRLKVERTIDPGLLKALMPPFSFQPLVGVIVMPVALFLAVLFLLLTSPQNKHYPAEPKRSATSPSQTIPPNNSERITGYRSCNQPISRSANPRRWLLVPVFSGSICSLS
jgi:two-component system LytT family sensor kinase